jgi:hypothetical protein
VIESFSDRLVRNLIVKCVTGRDENGVSRVNGPVIDKVCTTPAEYITQSMMHSPENNFYAGVLCFGCRHYREYLIEAHCCYEEGCPRRKLLLSLREQDRNQEYQQIPCHETIICKL